MFRAPVSARAKRVADAIARSALPPSEIPLGLVTAVAGGPFLVRLLAHRLRGSRRVEIVAGQLAVAEVEVARNSHCHNTLNNCLGTVNRI